MRMVGQATIGYASLTSGNNSEPVGFFQENLVYPSMCGKLLTLGRQITCKES